MRSLPSLALQNGVSEQWALPVTGSSSMPTAGAKKRETKSMSGASPRGGGDERLVLAAQCREVGGQRAHLFFGGEFEQIARVCGGFYMRGERVYADSSE